MAQLHRLSQPTTSHMDKAIKASCPLQNPPVVMWVNPGKLAKDFPAPNEQTTVIWANEWLLF